MLATGFLAFNFCLARNYTTLHFLGDVVGRAGAILIKGPGSGGGAPLRKWALHGSSHVIHFLYDDMIVITESSYDNSHHIWGARVSGEIHIYAPNIIWSYDDLIVITESFLRHVKIVRWFAFTARAEKESDGIRDRSEATHITHWGGMNSNDQLRISPRWSVEDDQDNGVVHWSRQKQRPLLGSTFIYRLFTFLGSTWLLLNPIIHPTTIIVSTELIIGSIASFPPSLASFFRTPQLTVTHFDTVALTLTPL